MAISAIPLGDPRVRLLPRDALAELDQQLAALARGGGALRLRIGEALEALKTRSFHHELGFSSLSGYALERCQQTGRWAAESCALARKLGGLPRLRAALSSRTLSWSMVQLLARYATTENEETLIAEAAHATVRQVRGRLTAHADDIDDTDDSDDTVKDEHGDGDRVELTLTVTRRDAWLLDCTRWLFNRVQPNASVDEFVHWILAEGLGTLRELVPEGEMNELDGRLDALRAEAAAWRAQRQKWSEQAEELCESTLELSMPNTDHPARPDWEISPEAYSDPIQLDAHIRRLCRELAERDVLLGVLAERLWRSEGWRRLGFASELQYARERLGMSLSAVKTKRALARRAERMPRVVDAIERGELGFEAALLVTRIATASTIDAWIARARERTVKLLREEVDAAELRIRLGAPRDQLPPDASVLKELADARQETSKLLCDSGQMSEGAPAKVLPLSKLARTVLSQISAGVRRIRVPRQEASTGADRGFGRVMLRFHVSEDTRDLWHEFELHFARLRSFLPSGATPIALLCVSFYCVWAHVVDPKMEYAPIYARDGFICQNPLCCRRDLTPHHLRFRSAGGGEEEENLVSACTWCHLEGIHGGRIKARPPASDIRWELGRPRILVVQGRRKLVAESASAPG